MSLSTLWRSLVTTLFNHAMEVPFKNSSSSLSDAVLVVHNRIIDRAMNDLAPSVSLALLTGNSAFCQNAHVPSMEVLCPSVEEVTEADSLWVINETVQPLLMPEICGHNNENLVDPALEAPFRHQFHIVDPSPWPIFVSMSLWLTLLSVVAVFNKFSGGVLDLLFGASCLIVGAICWWQDIISESTYELKHTPIVRRGLLLGMALFIVSEALLFFGFFWAFFHSSLVPSSALGGVWPPVMIQVISPWKLPLVNTLTLIMSGFTVTIAHRALKNVPYLDTAVRYVYLQKMCFWLLVTVGLAVFFLCCQAFEYYFAEFCLNDTIYGTTFYTLTGLHGAHVIVGTIFLSICLLRASFLHFTSWKQVGFKSAVWYWHFVDVVWILLFFTVYIWGGAGALV